MMTDTNTAERAAYQRAVDLAKDEIARLTGDVKLLHAALAQAEQALKDERRERQIAEADRGWWHATVANYVTSATVEDRELLRGTLAEAVTYPHPGAALLAELNAARAVVWAAKEAEFTTVALGLALRNYDKLTKARDDGR